MTDLLNSSTPLPQSAPSAPDSTLTNLLKSPRTLQIVNIVAALGFALGLALVFFATPRERVMGEVQRVFYFHVPFAWVGFVALFVAMVTGIVYLRTQRRIWDIVSYVSIEIGLVFAVITILSGSIWARPAWNTWWTWDPRLTTYTIMVLIYTAYLMLRQSLDDPGRRARFSAIYAIFSFISVPITYFSIRWWRTIHPVVVGNGSAEAQGGFDMTPAMQATFAVTNLVILVLYLCFLYNRVRLELEAEEVEHLKAQVHSS